MRALVFPFCCFKLLFVCGSFRCDAQETVAAVTQLLPFATQGQVAVIEKPVPIPEVKINKSPGSMPVAVTNAVSYLAQAGGSVSTGANGTTSLVLGVAGAARMKAETEVKLPETSGSSHSLEMLKGRLFMNINGEALKKRSVGEFKLKTPAALLAVKGTKFFTLSSNGTDTIGVHHGTVVVTEPQSGQSLSVDAGNVVTASAGMLSKPRPLSAAEARLIQEYDLAGVRIVPLPSIVSRGPPNPQIMSFREGHLITTGPLPASSFDQLDAHLWWSHKEGKYNTGEISITAEGYVRHDWHAGRHMSHTSIMADFRGQQLMQLREVSGAKPLLKVIGLRFRLRAQNVVRMNFMQYQYSQSGKIERQQEVEIPVAKLNAWQDMVVPLIMGDRFLSNANIAFATTTLNVAAHVNIEDFTSELPNKQPSVLEMSDFELLVVP